MEAMTCDILLQIFTENINNVIQKKKYRTFLRFSENWKKNMEEICEHQITKERSNLLRQRSRVLYLSTRSDAKLPLRQKFPAIAILIIFSSPNHLVTPICLQLSNNWTERFASKRALVECKRSWFKYPLHILIKSNLFTFTSEFVNFTNQRKMVPFTIHTHMPKLHIIIFLKLSRT